MEIRELTKLESGFTNVSLYVATQQPQQSANPNSQRIPTPTSGRTHPIHLWPPARTLLVSRVVKLVPECSVLFCIYLSQVSCNPRSLAITISSASVNGWRTTILALVIIQRVRRGVQACVAVDWNSGGCTIPGFYFFR